MNYPSVCLLSTTSFDESDLEEIVLSLISSLPDIKKNRESRSGFEIYWKMDVEKKELSILVFVDSQLIPHHAKGLFDFFKGYIKAREYNYEIDIMELAYFQPLIVERLYSRDYQLLTASYPLQHGSSRTVWESQRT